MLDSSLPAYAPDLSPSDLDRTLSELVDRRRRCEWLLCRYLADMADEQRFRSVGWYSDVYHYARARLSLSVKVTRERVRMGRALRTLPAIEQAFVSGELSYSQVRELTRVADADSERMWLETAARVGIRELERRVAGAIGGEACCDAGAEVRWRTPETVRLEVDLPAAAWALLSRAMEGARLASESPLSDAQALEAVAREALSSLNEPDSVSIADPRRAVVLYRCGDCTHTELETTAGAVALPAGQAEALTCDAQTIDLSTEGRAEACVGGSIPAAIRRAVMARERGRCRVCGRRRYVDVHHIEPQSEGGAHSRENCCLLCTTCHAALHEGKLRLEGNGEMGLKWFDSQGQLLGSDAGLPSEDEPRAGPDRTPGLSPEAARVLAAMDGRGGWNLDMLVFATGLPISKVSAALTRLELTGRVEQAPWGYYTPMVARRRSSTESIDAPRGASHRPARAEASRGAHSAAPCGAPSAVQLAVAGAGALARAPRGARCQTDPTRAPRMASAEPPGTARRKSHLPDAPRGAQPDAPQGRREVPGAASELFAEAEPEVVAACDAVLAAMTAQDEGSRRPWHADWLVAATGLSSSTASRALLLLQLSGRVREQGLGHYVPT